MVPRGLSSSWDSIPGQALTQECAMAPTAHRSDRSPQALCLEFQALLQTPASLPRTCVHRPDHTPALHFPFLAAGPHLDPPDSVHPRRWCSLSQYPGRQDQGTLAGETEPSRQAGTWTSAAGLQSLSLLPSTEQGAPGLGAAGPAQGRGRGAAEATLPRVILVTGGWWGRGTPHTENWGSSEMGVGLRE